MRYDVETYSSDNKLLAGVMGMRSPIHVAFDASKVTADAEGQKHFDGGFWVAKSGDLARPLPRSKTSADTATTDTVIAVDGGIQAFVPGDMLYIIPASAQIDLGAAWAIGNDITITVAGVPYSYAADAALTAEQFAAAVAADFNVNPQTRGIAQAIPGTAALTIVAADFKTPHSITVAATGGTAALANGATLLFPYRLIGEVDAAGVDVVNQQLTLNSTAAVPIGKGVPIGTADIPLGMHLRAHDMNRQAEEAGLYTSLSGKRGAFPYIDGGLEASFVEIQATNL